MDIERWAEQQDPDALAIDIMSRAYDKLLSDKNLHEQFRFGVARTMQSAIRHVLGQKRRDDMRLTFADEGDNDNIH